MKDVNKKHPIDTIPEGIWESSHHEKDIKEIEVEKSSDLQGNGYPECEKPKSVRKCCCRKSTPKEDTPKKK